MLRVFHGTLKKNKLAKQKWKEEDQLGSYSRAQCIKGCWQKIAFYDGQKWKREESELSTEGPQKVHASVWCKWCQGMQVEESVTLGFWPKQMCAWWCNCEEWELKWRFVFFMYFLKNCVL